MSASYADRATSASYAHSASYEIVKEVSSSYADTASYAVTASYALNSEGSSLWYDGTTYFSSSLPIKVDSHITASGDISASGDIIGKDLYLDEYIKHNGEPTQTYIRITDKRFRFSAGGIQYIDINDNAGPPRDITFNDGGNNVDFTIKGTSDNPLFKTDASENRIGTNGQGSPSADFHIGGNLKTQSHITASGNISASGTGSFGSINGPIDGDFAIRSDKNINLYVDNDNDGSFHKFQLWEDGNDIKFR